MHRRASKGSGQLHTTHSRMDSQRENRKIVGATRAMLYDQDMPKFLWAEACSTAMYIQNTICHRTLGKMTPEEAFIGKKPEVRHFRIFGSITV